MGEARRIDRREERANSAELQGRYGLEYASMLRVGSNRDLAKDAARLNVSAIF